jgi:hypothetical protein
MNINILLNQKTTKSDNIALGSHTIYQAEHYPMDASIDIYIE